MFFWIIAGLVLLSALFLLVYPLLSRSKSKPGSGTSAKIALSKRLDELKAELAAGLIEQRFYEKAQTEAREAFASQQPEPKQSHENRKHPLLAGVLLFMVATGSVLTYLSHSNGYQHMLATQEVGKVLGGLLDLIDELEENLAENPEAYEDWRLLARARKNLQQYGEAAAAYAQLERLDRLYEIEDLRDYAESLVMGEQAAEKARELLDRVLLLDAEDYAALYLYGVIEFNEENYPRAIERWQALDKLMEGENPRWRNEVRMMIEEARIRDSDESESSAETFLPLLNVSISISPDLDDKVDAADTAFVYIKAIDGPPMPLAVKRLGIDELEQLIVFSDADAMLPSLLPSAFEQLELTARITKTGKAQRQTGDLIGVSEAVVRNQELVTVNIIIDRIVE